MSDSRNFLFFLFLIFIFWFSPQFFISSVYFILWFFFLSLGLVIGGQIDWNWHGIIIAYLLIMN